MKKNILKKIFFLVIIIITFTITGCEIPKPPVTEPTVTENQTIEYTIIFNSNGGSIIENLYAKENSKIIAPANPTKEGYTFIGWYKDSNLTTKWDFDNDIVLSQITLYAKWDKINEPTPIVKYTVTFESNGGSTISAIQIDENSKVTVPQEPTKSGYIFGGWYKEQSLTNKWDFSNDIVKSNITLYAKWDKKDSNTSFNNISQTETYYASAYSLTGDALKAELHKITEKTHTTKLSYSQVWNALKKADKGEGDNVICIYTGVLHAFSKQDSGSAGADIWNREHVWPNSKGFENKSHTAYSDVHHLFASNKNINATRGNKDFGDFELLGISSSGKDNYGNLWNSTYFEPRDEVKGDLARALFYMVIRYDGDVCGSCNLDLELVLGASTSLSNSYDKIGRLGDLESLIKWHYEDPVSEAELARNEIIFGLQGNRNPFIDHPELIGSLYYEYAKEYLNN